jgi:glucokinase
MTTILAGDVGGTKTVLAVYQIEQNRSATLKELHKNVFASADYDDFVVLVNDFLQQIRPDSVDNVCLGIAGPIQNQRCEATNLPWIIDAGQLSERYGFEDVLLMNDLEAAAYGMIALSSDSFVELNRNAIEQTGHAAVIAAGTGLGQAIMAWDGKRYIVLPTEGGHTDFAGNNELEDALLRYLRERFGGHVSYERILSGDGMGNLYDFLKASSFAEPDPAIEAEMADQDRNAVIGNYGVQGKDPLCMETVRLFTRIYGNEAGNLALKCLPKGGLFIGGGIAPKLRPAIESGEFMAGFLDKGRMSRAIETIPVKICLNPDAPLLGAAYMAKIRAC